MTPEQKAAFVISRAAHLNAEIARLTAENQQAAFFGEKPPYGNAVFREIIAQYEDITYNQLIVFFRD